MARFTALLDACVLVPISLADTLLRLAEADLFRPVWSEQILDEMVAAIETVHPDLADGRARGRADAMNNAFDDALVPGWESLIEGMRLPDPDDRHVVAAAHRGRADIIVTANIRDFPPDVLKEMDLEAQTPDEFLLNQLDLEPDLTIRALHQQAASTRNPAMDPEALLDRLSRCGAPKFAKAAGHQLWRNR